MCIPNPINSPQPRPAGPRTGSDPALSPLVRYRGRNQFGRRERVFRVGTYEQAVSGQGRTAGEQAVRDDYRGEGLNGQQVVRDKERVGAPKNQWRTGRHPARNQRQGQTASTDSLGPTQNSSMTPSFNASPLRSPSISTAEATRVPSELLDAHAVARLLGCDRAFVYEHQAELGAIRLGAGPKARLRFDRSLVEAFMVRRDEPKSPESRRPRTPRRRTRTSSVKLLPIKGRP